MASMVLSSSHTVGSARIVNAVVAVTILVLVLLLVVVVAVVGDGVVGDGVVVSLLLELSITVGAIVPFVSAGFGKVGDGVGAGDAGPTTGSMVGVAVVLGSLPPMEGGAVPLFDGVGASVVFTISGG